MRYFINGLFAQRLEQLGIGYDQTGARVILESFNGEFGFSGIFDAELGEGGLSDYYGSSDLSDIVLTNETLTFTKTYHRTGNSVTYRLSKVESDWWDGKYDAPALGKDRYGVARCMLTEIPKDFLAK